MPVIGGTLGKQMFERSTEEGEWRRRTKRQVMDLYEKAKITKKGGLNILAK